MVEAFDGNISPHQTAKWSSESGQEAKRDKDAGKEKLRNMKNFT